MAVHPTSVLLVCCLTSPVIDNSMLPWPCGEASEIPCREYSTVEQCRLECPLEYPGTTPKILVCREIRLPSGSSLSDFRMKLYFFHDFFGVLQLKLLCSDWLNSAFLEFYSTLRNFLLRIVKERCLLWWMCVLRKLFQALICCYLSDLKICICCPSFPSLIYISSVLTIVSSFFVTFLYSLKTTCLYTHFFLCFLLFLPFFFTCCFHRIHSLHINGRRFCLFHLCASCSFILFLQTFPLPSFSYLP